MQNLLQRTGQTSIPFIHFWPEGRRYALVLTHDIETAIGQARVRELADIDASYGFRSSFNFVAEQYPLDLDLIAELRHNGFEVGIHGLKHDGQLFRSRRKFLSQAESINRHVAALGVAGFRAPCTHRNPGWMQELDIEYDLSYFDTDPYEPIPGGTMSLWPFEIGRFVELPYTLAQDFTLTEVVGPGGAVGLGTAGARLYLADGSRGVLLLPDAPLLHVFVRRGSAIHHFYTTEMFFAPTEPGQHPRHIDPMWPLWNLFDMTLEGRGEGWYPKLSYER